MTVPVGFGQRMEAEQDLIAQRERGGGRGGGVEGVSIASVASTFQTELSPMAICITTCGKVLAPVIPGETNPG